MFDTHPKSITITSKEPSGDSFPINANETMAAKTPLRPGEHDMCEKVLVNPQPMETLPDGGTVFCEWENPVSGEKHVSEYDVFGIRFAKSAKDHGTFHAWSRTATFEKGTS